MHKADINMEGSILPADLPTESRDILIKLAEKYSSGKVKYRKLMKDVRDTMYLHEMSFDELIMLVLKLVAEDARNDLKQLLDFLESTRLKKQALLLEQQLLKRELSCLKKKFRKQVKRKKKMVEHYNSIEKAVKDLKLSRLDKEKPFLAYDFRE